MICAPALLPQLFVETPIPDGAISDEAANAIAALLWQAAEDEQGSSGQEANNDE
jgi:hypothetical protein